MNVMKKRELSPMGMEGTGCLLGKKGRRKGLQTLYRFQSGNKKWVTVTYDVLEGGGVAQAGGGIGRKKKLIYLFRRTTGRILQKGTTRLRVATTLCCACAKRML